MKVEVRSSGILAYQRVPEGVVISGITADGENLYWLNYGARDHLGNYNNDGALLSDAQAGQSPGHACCRRWYPKDLIDKRIRTG